jgi:DNA polymerase (family 10)
MLPQLIELEDMKGTFHIHTESSDGVDSLERLVDTARKMGLHYIGVSDHSQSAYYAGGLKVDALHKQWETVDRLNQEMTDFYIFKGIESDILPDGSLDYDEATLKSFDFVIGSIHSSFTMKKEDQERRILRAMENPYLTMLGHPTGRLLLSRDGFDVDMRTLIDGAARNNVIIELNASPYRLDIDWRYLKYAKEKGVMISINPDAHNTSGLYEIMYGVGIARKGWQEKRDILNTRTAAEVKEILRKRK